MSDEAPSPEQPTPYAVAKRMRAEGHPRARIVEQLKAIGLDDSDVDVLLRDHPPEARPAGETSDGEMLLKVGALVVGGPILGGLVVAALSEAAQPQLATAPQQPLAPDDPSARCALHPELASLANCPRCGAFTCRQCAPKPGQPVCVSCQRSPITRDLRITRAMRWMAVWMFCVAGTALLLAVTHLEAGLPLLQTAIGFGISGGPFLAIGLIQLKVRNLWPCVLATAFLVPSLLFATVSYLWIAMAAVMVISSLLARGEIKAAKKAHASLTVDEEDK